MKARSKELLGRAIAATVASIEIYNKPDFLYREEAFAVLAINGWELLLKAKWLSDHNNNIRSLYVHEPMALKNGKRGKKLCIKLTRSQNPFTHSLDYLGAKLVEQGKLDEKAWKNLQALLEIRDSAIHFYNRAGNFALRLQEIGTATLKNFVAACRLWFNRDLSEFNFYLMPLSFVSLPQSRDALVLNAEEKNFVNFVDQLEGNETEGDSEFSVSVNIEVRFTRSKAKDALGVRVTNELTAPAVRLTDEQIRERYPWDYRTLCAKCRERYKDFKEDKKYHSLRKPLANDKRFGAIRFLDPGNPKSQKKAFFNPNILAEFDKHYTKR
jgi:hypothetical protein